MPLRADHARKAEMVALTGFSTWMGHYAWGWLAALVAIPIAVRQVFITPNDPVPWSPPDPAP